MSLKDKVEDWLDDKIGRSGRKALEQVGHALMAGLPAFLVVNWLPDGLAWQVPLGFLSATLLGGLREYFQNVGDAPEGSWFVVARVPVNGDLILDMLAYGVGGIAAGFLGFVI